jgi:FAD/FMN-containing dehydrogenase
VYLFAVSLQCDVLLNITMIDGKGQVHQLKRISPEGLAVCAGMGLLGIVTEMTIQLTPTTHTKLITRYLANDTNLVDDIEKMLKVCVQGCSCRGEGNWPP